MKFRWTMKELDEASDTFVLRSLVSERLADLNPYTPLAKRLRKVSARLDKQLERAEMRKQARKANRTAVAQ